MMEIIAYGEDSLTLWALKTRIKEILHKLGDNTPDSQCIIFYRPSFGRRGGKKSSQFGEFDFIILSKNRLYLGESKWNRSKGVKNGILKLSYEQKLRHKILKFYIDQWFKDNYSYWKDFITKAKQEIKKYGINKPLAPEKSLLTSNLETILKIIKENYRKPPEIINILLYLHNKTTLDIPKKVDGDFKLVLVDYSQDTIDNLIKIEI